MLPEQKFVVEGVAPLSPVADVSFGELIYQSLLSSTKRHPALVNSLTGESISFPQLLEETCTLGEALRKSGYGTNTVISIGSKNSFEFCTIVVASLYIGATIVPTNHEYTLNELEYSLNMTKPEVIFCTQDVVDKYLKIKDKVNFIDKIIVIDSDEATAQVEYLKDFIQKNQPIRLSRISTTEVDIREHIAVILSSSGTSGLPKGVMLTDRNWNTMAYRFSDTRFFNPNSVINCVLPFSHVFGLTILLTGLINNDMIIFSNKFEVDSFLKAIEDYKVTRLYLLPGLVVLLSQLETLKYDLSSVEDVLCGSAPMTKETEAMFNKRFTSAVIRQGYGMTEGTAAITLNETSPAKIKPGSSGRVLPYGKLAVKDLETGAFLGPNQSGELCIKGTSIMKRYCDNVEATKNSFDQNGWMLTGDVGYYDMDEYIYITGRIKELIKYNGYQIAPAELEAFLLTHPDIKDSAVIGIPHSTAGELPLAFIVKNTESKLTQEDVKNFVKSELSPQKWLRGGVLFVDNIPKNKVGKILRNELRSLLN